MLFIGGRYGQLSRAWLDVIGKARPATLSKFQMLSVALKAITRKISIRFSNELLTTSCLEQRKTKKIRFYSKADHKIGKQLLKDRCDVLNELSYDWTHGFSDDRWRIRKNILGFQPEGVVFPLGWGTSASI